MPQFQYDPPLPRRPGDQPFVQKITLIEAGQPIGTARWHAAPSARDGVIQLLDLAIDPVHRRRGHGHRLMEAVLDQSRKFQALKNLSLRRMWLNLEQKDQIIARAFLMSHNFHHVGSIPELLTSQDALIYMRSFD